MTLTPNLLMTHRGEGSSTFQKGDPKYKSTNFSRYDFVYWYFWVKNHSFSQIFGHLLRMNSSADLDLENNIIKSPSPNATTFSPNSNSDHQQCCKSPNSKEELTTAEEERNFSGSAENRLLKFSIESILQPDFGKNSSNERCFPLEFPSTPPFSSPEICCNISSILSQSTVGGLRSNEFLPSWIFCTRYSDRPSSGPRIRKIKRREVSNNNEEEKRPRTAFTADQLERLKSQFISNRYLTEKRRQELAHELGLNESQIKIWFQNKRAKLKKSSQRAHQSASAAVLHQLMAQGGGIYQQK